jgi:hypothetical protein
MTEMTDNKAKFSQFRKRLLKESAIFVAALGLLGGLTYYLGMLSDDFVNKNNSLQSAVGAVAGEMTTLQDKYNKVQQNKELYDEAMRKSLHGGLAINRETIRDRFNQFKDEYHLNNLRLSMGAIEDLADAQYKRKSNAINSSRVTVDFNALSDEPVFTLITSMQQDLPGGAKVTKLSLTRADNGLTDDILRVISTTGAYPMVRGNMEFTWLGIKPVEPGDSNANAKKP